MHTLRRIDMRKRIAKENKNEKDYFHGTRQN